MGKARTLQDMQVKNPRYKNTESNVHKEHNVREIAEFSEQQKYLTEKFAKMNDVLRLADLTKNETRTYSTFSKETLRGYMKNPKANEDNLRSLSQFLYRMCFPYRRIIHYYSEMIESDKYVVIPKNDHTQEPDLEATKQQYFETAEKMEWMNLPMQTMQMFIIAWLEDCFYGYTYYDDESFFVYPLPGQYCKVSSSNFDGTLNFAFDFSYFRSNAAALEYWDKEFEKKYNAFLKDPSLRWQELDPERTVCLKVNIEDRTLVIPPFCSIFEQLIDLCDIIAAQATNDEAQDYKMLVANLETSKSGEPDDFTVDLDTALTFYNRLADSLPPGVAAAISPLKIEPVTFKDDATEGINRVSTSVSNLFANVGVTQILDATKISGSTAFKASILCDTLMATKILLPQLEAWVNRFLKTQLSDPAKIKFIKTTPYTEQDNIDKLKDAATLGVPVKVPLGILEGFSPMDIADMQVMEEAIGVLDWQPMQSSYTTAGSDPTDKGGRPVQDEVTDEGEATRDGDKNDKG